MFETDLATILTISIFAGVIIYKISFLNKKSIGYLSLMQIIYLVVIPSFIYTVAFSHLQSILTRPLNEKIIIPDGLLVNVLLMSILFTYGGLAIHAVTKMLAHLDSIRFVESDAHEMIRFFHQKFSHNLILSGAAITALCFTLLELNHEAAPTEQNVVWAITKGLVLGFSTIGAMLWYTSKPDGYFGKWSDLKTAFLFLWLSIVLVIYGIRKTHPSFSEYQLLLPILLGYSVIAMLNIFLVLRRLKRGGFRVYFRWGTIKQRLLELKRR